MIITIGRKCGCCGDEIGHALEQIYHIPFYDRSVISELAKDMECMTGIRISMGKPRWIH